MNPFKKLIKPMKNLLTTIFLFLTVASININAQYYLEMRNISSEYDPNTDTYRLDYGNIKGDPFLNEDWEIGKVIFNDKSQSQNINLRFNSYSNQLFFKEGDKVLLINLNEIQGFVFNKKEEIYKVGITSSKYRFDGKQAFRLIYNGDVKLYEHLSVDHKSSKHPMTGELNEKFDRDEAYYIQTEDGELVKTRIRKKNLINDLGIHKKELEKFTKDTKNKVKSEEDAVKLLEFYDSLK